LFHFVDRLSAIAAADCVADQPQGGGQPEDRPNDWERIELRRWLRLGFSRALASPANPMPMDFPPAQNDPTGPLGKRTRPYTCSVFKLPSMNLCSQFRPQNWHNQWKLMV
jgi:hypothetical protein